MVRDDRRLLIFTFSFSVIITNEHFLAPGVLEEMVTFVCPEYRPPPPPTGRWI